MRIPILSGLLESEPEAVKSSVETTITTKTFKPVTDEHGIHYRVVKKVEEHTKLYVLLDASKKRTGERVTTEYDDDGSTVRTTTKENLNGT